MFEIAAYQGGCRSFIKGLRNSVSLMWKCQKARSISPQLQEGTSNSRGTRVLECCRKSARKTGRSISTPMQPLYKSKPTWQTAPRKVIIEGRDSGKGVGIYDEDGRVRGELLSVLINGVADIGKIIIEAPQTSQHNYLLTKIGPNVQPRQCTAPGCAYPGITPGPAGAIP